MTLAMYRQKSPLFDSSGKAIISKIHGPKALSAYLFILRVSLLYFNLPIYLLTVSVKSAVSAFPTGTVKVPV